MEQLVVVGLRMEEEEEEDEVGAKTQEKESIWKGFSIHQGKGSIRNELLSNFVLLLKLSLRIKTPACFCKSRPKKLAGKVLNMDRWGSHLK